MYIVREMLFKLLYLIIPFTLLFFLIGSSTNWKCFAVFKNDNSIGQGEKADYFTSKATVIFMRKENSMYKVSIIFKW